MNILFILSILFCILGFLYSIVGEYLGYHCNGLFFIDKEVSNG
jgi:hypothetical protein